MSLNKAEELGREAMSSDPADWNGYVIVANANIYKGNYTEAEKFIAEGEKLFPENNNFENLYFMSKFYSADYASVILGLKDHVMESVSTVPENLLSYLCISYFKEGNHTESNRVLHILKERPKSPGSSPAYNLARIYSQYQMSDSCFASLERAFINREPELKYLKIDPLFNHLKQDPRYHELYHEYGFDRYK